MTKTLALSTLDEINTYVSESARRELTGKDRENLMQAARKLALAVQGDGYAWQHAHWIFTFLKTVFLGTEAQRRAHRQQILLRSQVLSRYLSGLREPNADTEVHAHNQS